MATEYKLRNISAPAVQFGEEAIVSGQLIQKPDSIPTLGTSVTITLAPSKASADSSVPLPQTVSTDAAGNFFATFPAKTLLEDSYSCTVTSSQAKDKTVNLKIYEVPSTSKCDPCTDIIATAKRVLKDPKVNRDLGEFLLGYGKNEKKSKGAPSLPDLKGTALTSLAKAVLGKDAVKAKADPCRGQCRLYFEFLEPMSSLPGTAPAAKEISAAISEVRKQMENNLSPYGSLTRTRKTQLSRDVLRTVNFQLLDEQLRIAGEGNRTFDDQGGILINEVEAGTVYISLLADLFGGAEIIDDFLATDAGGSVFTHYQRTIPSVNLPTAPPTSPSILGLAYTVTEQTKLDSKPVEPSYLLTMDASNGSGKYSYSITDPAHTGNPNTTGVFAIKLKRVSKNPFTVQVTDAATPKDMTTFDFSVDLDQSVRFPISGTATALTPKLLSAPLAVPTGPSQRPGISFGISGGLETRVVVFMRPPAARVHCYSFLEGDDCCGQGKQYISKVSISAFKGNDAIECRQTGDSGCSGFNLNPGWYEFSSPREITIGGCNYMLSSSSPVSAFLGAGQSCSDIYFSYKKKGNEIQVISEISSALGGDPYKEAKVNFADMAYLLLREDDMTFAQQQTTQTGGAVIFRNLTAGTYLLFCQAPATYGSQPVTPVYPADGRLSLRIFGGQTSRVPVLVKFRTTTVAPAVLDGYVRDNSGYVVPQQLVQILDNGNRLVAAGLTDSNGYYSIQIYKAEDLTVLVGAQQYTVSKELIQASMNAVGTPALPSPDSTFGLAMQTSELARF